MSIGYRQRGGGRRGGGRRSSGRAHKKDYLALKLEGVESRPEARLRLQWQKGMVGAVLIYACGMGAVMALGGTAVASGLVGQGLSGLERAGCGGAGAGGAAMAALCGWAFGKATRQIDEQIAELDSFPGSDIRWACIQAQKLRDRERLTS